ncbi:MAG: flavin reductase family protein [Chloroflexi bacterium]|nr:flavin reductase family protein [Chloroflexota bacterium]
MSKQEIALHLAHRLTAGRPVCLLTVRYKGQVNVMSLGWAVPLSAEPPLMGLAIHPACYTHDMLIKSQECVLNIPARPLAEQVLSCGTVSGAQTDKITLTHLHLDNGRRVETPWISECLAHIECALVSTSAPGDHTLFIVEIVGAWAEEAAFKDGLWLCPRDDEELQPLVHLGGTMFTLLSSSFIVNPDKGSS